MRKLFLYFFGLLGGGYAAAQGPYPPSASEPGTTAMYRDSSAFIAWATSCEVVRGWMDIADTTLGKVSYGTPSNATGFPDNSVVSLGDKGYATLTFNGYLYNGQGYDFAVFENSFSDDFLELAFVEVSSDNNHFVRFPAVSLTQDTVQVGTFGSLDATYIHNLAGKYRGGYGTPFDLDDLKDSANINIDSIVAIRIIDVCGNIDTAYASYDSQGNKINDPYPTAFESGGFDLDAVGAIHIQFPLSNPAIVESGLVAYPNPFNQELHIFSESQQQITVYSLSGKIIYSNTITDTQKLSTENWGKGVYFIQTKEGKIFKIVKI